jgi:hypothetical protein
MKILYLLLVLSMAVSTAFSQSIFEPLPTHGFAPPNKPSIRARATVITAVGDSIFSGFRIGGISALVAIGTNSTSAIYAGFTAGYEHDTKKVSTGRWTTDYAIEGGIYGGAGKQAPTNWQTTGAIGLSVVLLNKHLVLGILYDFVIRKPLAATGPNGYLTPTN